MHQLLVPNVAFYYCSSFVVLYGQCDFDQHVKKKFDFSIFC